MLNRRQFVWEPIVDDSRDVDLDHRPTQSLVVHLFADRRLHEMGPGEENGPVSLNDQGLVRHDRQVGATGYARAENYRNLVDPLGRQACIVKKDTTEMVSVGEDLLLHRQKDPGRVDQIDQRQAIFHRDLLRPQDFLAGQREPRPRFDRSVVRHHHAFTIFDSAEAHNHAGRRRATPLPVQIPGRERTDFEQLSALVNQGFDPFTREQLAFLFLLGCSLFAATHRDFVSLCIQDPDPVSPVIAVGFKHHVTLYLAVEDFGHGKSPCDRIVRGLQVDVVRGLSSSRLYGRTALRRND